MRNSSHLNESSFSYIITDANGTRVASAEQIEDALFWLRTLPEAEQVSRDGIALAHKKRFTPKNPLARA